MKTNEFKSLVKEIVKEVISEMNETVQDEAKYPGKQHDLYPKGTDTQTSDDIIKARNVGWKRHMQMYKDLQKIHDEPEFKEKLHALRVRQGDEEPDFE